MDMFNYGLRLKNLGIERDLWDNHTREHSKRVQELCKMLADELFDSHEHKEKLCQAAWLHDIGKMAVPPSVLHKEEPLSYKELECIRDHPQLGYRIVKTLPEYRACASIILFHHERWDAMGYPMGIGGYEIPREARLLAIIDSFDAMITPRSYNRVMSVSEALEEIRSKAGTQFDPELAEAAAVLIPSLYDNSSLASSN